MSPPRPERPKASDLLKRPDQVSLAAVRQTSSDSSQPIARADRVSARQQASNLASKVVPLRKITVAVPAPLYREFKLLAVSEDLPVSNVLEALMRAYVAGEIQPDVEPIREQRREAMARGGRRSSRDS